MGKFDSPYDCTRNCSDECVYTSDCVGKFHSPYDCTRNCADECVSILVTVWVSFTVHMTVLGTVLMSVCLY